MSFLNTADRNVKIALAAAGSVVAAGLAYWAYSAWSSKEETVCAKKGGVPKAGERVRTPFGYGYVDKTPVTETGLYRVHLPNKTMGYLNPDSVERIPCEPIYVRTPFGLGELVAPKQTTPDLKGDANELFVVKLPFATANVNLESLRVANFEPFPSVETPDGAGRIVEPTQDGPTLKPNHNYQFVVQLDSAPAGQTKLFDAKYVERMQRGHVLEN